MKKYLFTPIMLFIALFSVAQESADSMAFDLPKIFLNCQYCDQDYYKNEISFLTFVRDQRLADITVLFREIRTGSGGIQITLEFDGHGKYADIHYQDTVNTQPNMSENDTRQLILASLNRGALPFLLRSPVASRITYQVSGINNDQPADSIRDKWNLWIFNLNGGLWGNGQEYTSNVSLNAFVSANRTSEKHLFEAGFWYNNNNAVYKIENEDPIRINIRQFGMYNQQAFSIGNHWALGYSSNLTSNTVANMNSNVDFAPAIEYNVFPYSEATKRQFRFNYRVGVRYVDYVAQTYRLHGYDWFAMQSFNMRYRLIKNWGNVGVSVGTNHLYDGEHFYSVYFSPYISWNILKGLNVNLSGSYSIVRDQYFLRATEVSSNEVLTGQIQLKSSYDFFISCGISYAFGSMYNNVVNVRFQGI
jgi:hypothetical protein